VQSETYFCSPKNLHTFFETSKMPYLSTLAILIAVSLSAEAACPTDENGDVLKTFSIDGCNRCWCGDVVGSPMCTRMGCNGNCFMDYLPDTCNKCSCDRETGQAICTLAVCPSWYDWGEAHSCSTAAYWQLFSIHLWFKIWTLLIETQMMFEQIMNLRPVYFNMGRKCHRFSLLNNLMRTAHVILMKELASLSYWNM